MIEVYEDRNIIYIKIGDKIIQYKLNSIIDNKLNNELENLFSISYYNLFKYDFNSNIFLFYLIKFLNNNLNKKLLFNNIDEFLLNLKF